MSQKLDEWVEQTKKRRKLIEELAPKDRLDLCSEIASLHGDLAQSLGGWLVWLKNPKIMNKLTEKELKETFEVYKKLALIFLDLDIKMSTAVSGRVKKLAKNKQPTKKTSYVA